MVDWYGDVHAMGNITDGNMYAIYDALDEKVNDGYLGTIVTSHFSYLVLPVFRHVINSAFVILWASSGRL